MTEIEAREIEGKAPSWFSFYYGRTDFGMLHKHHEKWYFVKKWREWQKMNFRDDFILNPENAEVVHLDMIKKLNEALTAESPNYNSNVTTSDYDEVILIVLGAGASFDFCGGKKRLPLTNGLFSEDYAELRSLYPRVREIYHDLADVVDLEGYFQKKWSIITRSYNPSLLKAIISTQFYLQQLMMKLSEENSDQYPNHYSALIQQMRDYILLSDSRVRFIVVSFNYDTLFEKELNKVMNYHFNMITDYDKPENHISLIKIHGSADWYRPFQKRVQHRPAKSFSEISSITNSCDFLPDIISQLSQEIEIFDGQTYMATQVNRNTKTNLKSGRNEFFNETYFMPHLLIPYASKDAFMVPDSQIRRMKTMLEKCSRAYCIGWKGNEKKFIDILEPLALDYTWITGGTGHEEILKSEAKRLTQSNHRYWTNGFASAMIHVRNNMVNMFDGTVGIGVNHG